MNRFVLVAAIIFVSGTALQAQDLRELVEEMKKMQTQITALQGRIETLERTVSGLRAEVDAPQSADLNAQRHNDRFEDKPVGATNGSYEAYRAGRFAARI